MATKQDLDWSFGLRNAAGKYLTAETFGSKIVCAATAMKKKQIWFLETSEGSEAVFIRSHLNKYLTVDGDGKFLGNGEGPGEEEAFIIESQDDGRWALKSQKYGWYAGGSGENLTAFTTEIAEDRLWTVRLAMHPMVTLRNIKRKKYVHLDDARGSLTTDEQIPWGDDAVLSVAFFEADGSYGIQSADGSYLSATGALVAPEAEDESCHFSLEFHGRVISFKSKKTGKYVTSLGASGLCKATKGSITADEKFQFENSYPQVTLVSNNGKKLSTKGGVEVSANVAAGEKTSDLEIFQLEPLGGSKWQVRTSRVQEEGGRLWVAGDGACSADGVESSEASTMDVEFYGNKIAFKTANGKYLSQQMNGYIKASAGEASDDDKSLFVFEIINRPRLALRGEYGFINTLMSGLLECNKSTAEIYALETKDGLVAIKDANNKYWKVGDAGISAASDSPEFYNIELFQNSKMAISFGGKYFASSQNGQFKADGSSGNSSACLFEY